MPTELEELVGFIANGNPQIRLVALENLIPYSLSQPSIFKAEDMKPVKNLTILLQDHSKIAGHALTILVNVSADRDVLKLLATNDRFLDAIITRLVKPDEPNANILGMLLANLAKWESVRSIVTRRQVPPAPLGSSDLVMNQLVDLFVKGAEGGYNKHATYDYLAYFFADLAKHAEVRQYFLQRQAYDGVIPLTKLKVFTEHRSDIRRKGVANTIKNVAFESSSHGLFLSETEINILPYLLLPITGGETYDEEEALEMLPDLQLLPPDKKRDPDPIVVQTHVETLTLLTTTREGRDLMRAVKVYPIIRETHLHVNDEGVREACERLVQILMRDEANDETQTGVEARAQDEEDRIVEV